MVHTFPEVPRVFKTSFRLSLSVRKTPPLLQASKCTHLTSDPDNKSHVWTDMISLFSGAAAVREDREDREEGRTQTEDQVETLLQLRHTLTVAVAVLGHRRSEIFIFLDMQTWSREGRSCTPAESRRQGRTCCSSPEISLTNRLHSQKQPGGKTLTNGSLLQRAEETFQLLMFVN
ncbi:Hypothetical predicted protein [Xyrichtys novacula]|uniref:Uncharacterized protein n=1 Tax=Xyrichtys novacula TaxID=13765 RepID=A0AAV1FVA2_XYRNO|nr:Hypothetical predicted protein [Xyrichtys novacula]